MSESDRISSHFPTQQSQVLYSKKDTYNQNKNHQFFTLNKTANYSFVEKKTSFLIFKNSNPWRIRWQLMIIILALYNLVASPLQVAFQTDQEYILYDIWIDIVQALFLFDILVMFRCTYFDSLGNQIFQGKAIAKRYITSGNFIIDVLAALPYDLIAEKFQFDQNNTLQLFNILKLNRLLRLSRIITYLRVNNDFKLMVRLVFLIFALFLFVHLIACFWHLIVIENQEWVPSQYLSTNKDFYQQQRSTRYFSSLYYAILMFLGTDILPYGRNQTVFVCFILIAGSLVTATLFGEMTVLVLNLNKKRDQFHQQLDVASQAMSNINLPQKLQTQVIDYLNFSYTHGHLSQDFRKFMQMISPSLQLDIKNYLYEQILIQNFILTSHQGVVNWIIPKLETTFQNPDDVIFQRGEVSEIVYFLAKGQVVVWLFDKWGQENQFNTLFPGDFFGQIGCVLDVKRTATIQSKNYSTLGQLGKKDFLDIIQRFGSVKFQVLEKIHHYYDSWHIFLIRTLKTIPYFTNLNFDQLSEIAFNLKCQKHQNREILVQRNHQIDYLAIVGSGQIQIKIERKRKFNITPVILQRGSVCFLDSVLSRAKQIYTVSIKKPGIILIITKSMLEDFKRRFPVLKKDMKEFLKKDYPSSDYVIGNNCLYKKSSGEILRIKFRIAVMRVLRKIFQQKQSTVLANLRSIWRAVDQLMSKRVKKTQEDEDDPDWELKRTVMAILSNTEILRRQLK